MSLASANKSVPWTIKDLEFVLKNLKEGKSRDPNGWVNDIFKKEAAGKYLKNSMLKLFNRMKAENYIPDFIRNADVVTIYKGKGKKCDLQNDRGIFLVTTFRSILMRLIYLDKYSIIDSNMSDSQVGGRKGRNVRNHVWVLNGVICDVLSNKNNLPIDIQIFDYKQCFDSLWLQECLSDLYSSGVNDDKLALLYNINTHVKVAVKTPVGKTHRESIFNVITQGDVFGPILCSNQVDTFGKECLEEGRYTYAYKGEVDIPPLGMVDDLVCIAECGPKTAMVNSYINQKTSSKKLQFGASKCKKLHVGHSRKDYMCQDLKVEHWGEVEIKNDESGEIEVQDIFEGEKVMDETLDEKYLGDVISNDGRNIKNIKARLAKGKGIVKQIINMLEGIPFGKHYFEVGVLLRDSLLVSSVLFNAEAWYNMTAAELNLVETIDISLLKQILNAPRGTPKEMIYLELGCIPLREIIREKRLRFLHYILNSDPKSIVHRFFISQMKHKTKKDWVTTVLNDLKLLDLDHLTMDNITEMKKTSYIHLIKQKIQEYTFAFLDELKKSHSKVEKIEHSGIQIQKYLQPNSIQMIKEEAQLIFKLRCRVTNIKVNLKGKYDTLECGACGKYEENQKHIIFCEELNENKDVENMNYEKLFNGTVEEKVKIAKHFKENFDKLENWKK